MKTIYAVMRLDRSIMVYGQNIPLPDGQKIPLPDGQYLIPCFDDYEQAKDAAGDRFEIVDMDIPE